MNDGEIAILIKAQDEFSGTLKRIEQNTKQSTQSLKDSFTNVQGAMLNLGNVALGVKQIFDIQENATIKLENAMDRLENAKIRAKQATNDLSIAEKKLVDIEKSHERDALSLERAQLSLEEAQNAYNTAVYESGPNSRAAREALINLKEAQFDLSDAQNLSKEKAQELSEAQQQLKDKQDQVTISSNNVDVAQRKLQKVLNDAPFVWIQMGVQILAVAGNLGVFLMQIPAMIAAVPVWYANAAGFLAMSVAGAPLWAIILAIIAAVGAAILIWKNWDKIMAALGVTFNWLKDNVFMPFWETLKNIWQWIKDFFLGTIEKAVGLASKVGSVITGKSSKTSSIKGSKASGGPINETGQYLLHKGEYVMPQGKENQTIIVNIDRIYGTDPQEISRALKNELSTKVII